MPFLATAIPAIVQGTATTAQVVGVLATAAAAAGTVYSARQSVKLGNQQAAISQQQAAASQMALSDREDERKRRLRRTVGTQRALYSASGVALEGTPVDVFADTAREFEYEDFADQFDTANRVDMLNRQASYEKAAGRQRAFSSLLDFGMSAAMR
jgi:hypothetical protein